MPQDAYTVEVMKHLPSALRPNPYNLAEVAMKAASKGWGARDLVAAIMADKPREAGHVIAAARRIADTPAPYQPGQNQTGPCQLDCDHGWHPSQDGHSVVPCPSCRPDTYRRVCDPTAQPAQGPVPHTYWRTNAEPQAQRQHTSMEETQTANPAA